MEEEVAETLLKHYLTKYDVKWELDKDNYRKLKIHTQGMTSRQITLIKKVIRIDEFKIDSVGFDLIVVDLGHYGGLK